jgi:hypothetical protein
MPTYSHGLRSIRSEALPRYPDPMTEGDLAKFLGISPAHARRRRLASPEESRQGWPAHHRKSIAPVKPRAGHRLAVLYRHSAVRRWMRGLEEVE